jgi:acetoin utilization protein AcuB
MKQRLVREWMTTDVISVKREDPLPDVHYLMTDKKIRRAPVMDKGKLVGVVTLGDVLKAEPSAATTLSVWELNYVLSKLKIEKVMTPKPVTISPDSAIGEAAQIMLEKKIGGLPVVETNGSVVGVITVSDIFRMVVEEWTDN